MVYLPPNNFGMLPEELSLYKESRVVILPVPYGATSTYVSGTQHGPDAIIKASHHLELYDRELGYIAECGIHTMNSVEPVTDPKKMIGVVESCYSELLGDEKFIVIIGGEHSLTLGAVKALRDIHTDMCVLQLDAHADLQDEYEGTPYNHACVMRRISEMCDFVGVGIRSLSEEEHELVKERRYKEYYAEDIIKRNSLLDKAISELSNDVYITIDLDVFDPSFMPAVGTPEPGGLDWYVVVNFLRKVFEKKNIIGFDIMELCPQRGNVSSDFSAAKLTYKLIGFKSRGGFK